MTNPYLDDPEYARRFAAAGGSKTSLNKKQRELEAKRKEKSKD